MVHSWPLSLRAGEIELRPLRRADRRPFEALRRGSASWLDPWEATDPAHPHWRPDFTRTRRLADRAGREGTALSLAILWRGRLAGQVSAAPILYGSQSTAVLGYWVGRELAGRGIAPRAVALLADHLLAELGIHRLEVLIRPENVASLRVAEKLGLREEGLRPRAVHVDGAWRDHRVFALTAEEFATDASGRGMLRRLERIAEESRFSRDTPVD